MKTAILNIDRLYFINTFERFIGKLEIFYSILICLRRISIITVYFRVFIDCP